MGNKFSLTEDKKQGLLIQTVMPLSPGADCGLKPNVDYIIKFNGNSVARTGPDQIMELVKVCKYAILNTKIPVSNDV